MAKKMKVAVVHIIVAVKCPKVAVILGRSGSVEHNCGRERSSGGRDFRAEWQ